MPPTFNPLSLFLGNIKRKRAITALESRGGLTDMTVADAETLVEELDRLMPGIQDKGEKVRCIRVLAEVYRKHVILPRSYIVSDVEQVGNWKSGRVADIWTGRVGQDDICIKAFRQYGDANQEAFKGAFYCLAVRWKHVSHPNVLPLLGVSGPETVPPFGLITPRMSNNIIEYTREHQDANRLLLLTDAARGLECLHLLDIVHGGINPGNILITPQGTACIGDFGIAEIMNNPHVTVQSGSAARQQGGARYMAPEQLEHSVTGKESDIHSFAITGYEVLVEIKPYPGVTGEVALTAQIVRGNRPFRPENEAAVRWLSDDTWGMLESCWTPKPSSRPTIKKFARVERSQKRMVPSDEPAVSLLTDGTILAVQFDPTRSTFHIH